ncbi:MAG: glutamine synthetase [Parvularculaceae bacterium]|nr:glutamine synthetase [Parvularculaceae bacterium]
MADNAAKLAQQARDFLSATPELKFVDAFVADLNGVLRGKRLPAKAAMKIFESGLRLPRSLVGVDIWGTDVLNNGLVVDTGDSDGVCVALEPGLVRAPWHEQPTAQTQLMMCEADGSPFLADPRQLLAELTRRLAARDLHPVTAIEVEFYLLSGESDDCGRPLTPRSKFSGRRVVDGRVYSMGEIDAYSEFFTALYAACEMQGLPLDTAVIEAGPSQFEVNLKHQPDILRAADQAMQLKRAIKGVAAQHGLLASFMAKPFGDLPGNGMHIHMSMLNGEGANAFDGDGDNGNALFKSVIAGLIEAAPESMVLFAPHLNSWRRFQESSHAPTRASWGYENRTAAIRVPTDTGANRRFEHRIAGADANPYLALAAIAAGALHGIERSLAAPAPLEGNAYKTDAPKLSLGWAAAAERFADGSIVAPAFGELASRVFTALKRQEIGVSEKHVSNFEYDTYLDVF